MAPQLCCGYSVVKEQHPLLIYGLFPLLPLAQFRLPGPFLGILAPLGASGGDSEIVLGGKEGVGGEKRQPQGALQGQREQEAGGAERGSEVEAASRMAKIGPRMHAEARFWRPTIGFGPEGPKQALLARPRRSG
jgi:hypothetical protein